MWTISFNESISRENVSDEKKNLADGEWKADHLPNINVIL